MLFGLEIAMLVIGVITLFRGQISLSKTRHVTGRPARLAGLIFALPLPLAYVVGAIFGYVAASSQRDAQSMIGTIALIEWGLVIGAIILGLLVLNSAKPPASTAQ
jgi:ABC-type Na+ efflux pump permease subunit